MIVLNSELNLKYYNQLKMKVLHSKITVMSQLVGLRVCCVSSELCSDHFPGQLCRPAGIIKDPPVWLDGARQLPKNVFKK